MDSLRPHTWARSDTGFNFPPVLLVLPRETQGRVLSPSLWEGEKVAHMLSPLHQFILFTLAMLVWVDARGATA